MVESYGRTWKAARNDENSVFLNFNDSGTGLDPDSLVETDLTGVEAVLQALVG